MGKDGGGGSSGGYPIFHHLEVTYDDDRVIYDQSVIDRAIKEALTKEWEEIHKWKPFLHFCQDWDFLLIDKTDEEFEHCHCYEVKK